MAKKHDFSHFVSVFHGQHLPEEDAMLAGYTALIQTYELLVPTPDLLSAISKKHKRYQLGDWQMYTPRHAPNNSLLGHLTFALKYEGINLSVLKALFNVADKASIIQIIKNEPTSLYSRRIWFLYEWLQSEKLPLPDATKGSTVDILNAALQYAGPPRLSKRHRIRNNLPGTPEFCPLIRKTEKLEHFINLKLRDRAQQVIGKIHKDILSRAAAFLLLKDSKASFEIEGESPPPMRMERWGQAIAQAGRHTLSHDEFLRLQQLIIPDFRFTHMGYRNEGGFIGEHERSTGMPLPDHISARWQDLFTLMNGLIACDALLSQSDMDAVLVGTVIAFGLVFIHPFEDGNGRIHRYLIHHALAEKKFSPLHIIFPVSAVILDRINEYREVLEAYSRPRLKLIDWHPTEKNNVDVMNETIDLYRYFDATKQAEFLYECIQLTIEETLPEEIDYLQKYDKMRQYIKNHIEMPDRMVDLLIRFLTQENGILSKRARSKEFSQLSENEISNLESRYAEIFKER